jgi:hypothetical protein
MCCVLWYGHPLAVELLCPLLDDTRSLEGFVVPMRVCDRAATSICTGTDEVSFDSETSTAVKDRQIQKIKDYCRRQLE